MDDAYIQYSPPTLITCGSFQSAFGKPLPIWSSRVVPPWKQAGVILLASTVGPGAGSDEDPPPLQETKSPSATTAAAARVLFGIARFALMANGKQQNPIPPAVIAVQSDIS